MTPNLETRLRKLELIEQYHRNDQIRVDETLHHLNKVYGNGQPSSQMSPKEFEEMVQRCLEKVYENPQKSK